VTDLLCPALPFLEKSARSVRKAGIKSSGLLLEPLGKGQLTLLRTASRPTSNRFLNVFLRRSGRGRPGFDANAHRAALYQVLELVAVEHVPALCLSAPPDYSIFSTKLSQQSFRLG
jgi:hypothetical protein